MNVYEEQEYSQSFNLGLWKKILHYIKPYRKYMLFLILVMAGTGGIDAVFPLMNRYAVDHFIVPGNTKGLWIFAIAYGGLVALQAVNVWLLIMTAGKIEIGVCYDIRKLGFKRLQELSFSYYDRTPVGWIMARMTSDTQRLGRLLHGISGSYVGQCYDAGDFVHYTLSELETCTIIMTVVPALAWSASIFKRRYCQYTGRYEGLIHGLPGHLTRGSWVRGLQKPW